MYNLFYFIATTALLLITIKKISMANESLQELLDRIGALEQGGVQTAQSLTNIAADITRIKDSLPTSGGIDAAGVEQLRTKLTNAETAINAAQSQAAGLDLENEPEAPAPTE